MIIAILTRIDPDQHLVFSAYLKKTNVLCTQRFVTDRKQGQALKGHHPEGMPPLQIHMLKHAVTPHLHTICVPRATLGIQ